MWNPNYTHQLSYFYAFKIYNYTRRVRKLKIHHVQADREIFYAYYCNTAVDIDPLPVTRAGLTMVELALFEWDVFEMAAPIQSTAKCEVRSVIRFFNAKSELPAEIHKQIVVVYGNVMKRQKWRSLAGKNFDDDDKVQEEVMTWFKGLAADFYDSGI